MKAWNFAILLLVFHAANSTIKDIIKLDKTTSSLMKNCSKIECPPVNNPVCAKLVYKQTGLVVHAVLINKCEKKYVECYPGVQAKLVSMKFCSHDHVNTGDQEIREKGKSFGYKRVKRGIRRDGDNKNKMKNDNSVVDMMAENIPMNTEEVTENLPMNKKVTENLPMNAEEEEIKGPAAFAILSLKGPAFETLSEREDASEDERFYESFNWPQIYPKIDMESYDADCPKTCPIRPVMVCGRCEHGIYTTFLSVCHMRMQYCSFKEDAIELVSRKPCMMLAPLLPMKTKGIVNEPNDDDKVLRYIWCRERNNRGVYCRKKTEEYQILSSKYEDTEELDASEDTDKVPVNAGKNNAVEDMENLTMNAEEDTENLTMNAEEDTLTMNAEEDTENLPRNE